MKKAIAYSILLINFFLTASFYPLVKDLLTPSNGVLIAFITIIAGCLPVGVLLLIITNPRQSPLSRHVILHCCLIGVCLSFLLIVLTQSLTDMNASEAAFFPCANGIIAALWSWKRSRASIWAAAAITFIGMLLLVMFNGDPNVTHWRGDLLALISTILYVVYFFLLEQLDVKTPRETWSAIGWQFLSMSGVALFVFLIFGNVPDHMVLSANDALHMLEVSFATIVIPVIFFPFIARHINALTIAFTSILEPLIAVALSWFFLQESFSWLGALGALLVIVGVVLQACSQRQKIVEEEINGRSHEGKLSSTI